MNTASHPLTSHVKASPAIDDHMNTDPFHPLASHVTQTTGHTNSPSLVNSLPPSGHTSKSPSLDSLVSSPSPSPTKGMDAHMDTASSHCLQMDAHTNSISLNPCDVKTDWSRSTRVKMSLLKSGSDPRQAKITTYFNVIEKIKQLVDDNYVDLSICRGQSRAEEFLSFAKAAVS